MRGILCSYQQHLSRQPFPERALPRPDTSWYRFHQLPRSARSDRDHLALGGRSPRTIRIRWSCGCGIGSKKNRNESRSRSVGLDTRCGVERYLPSVIRSRMSPMSHRKAPLMGGAAIQRDRAFTCNSPSSSCYRMVRIPVVGMLSDTPARVRSSKPARGMLFVQVWASCSGHACSVVVRTRR